MGQIRFTTPDGDLLLETPMGKRDTVMETAVREGVPGIEAECGGAMSCGTCHVFVASECADEFEPAEPDELEMIAGLDNSTERSRLSCQLIPITPDSPLAVTVPDAG